MEVGRHPGAGGVRPRRAWPDPGPLYSRTGETSPAVFRTSCLLASARAIDGELLVLREGRVQTFNVLQQRLNRKVVSPKLITEFPIHLRAYDLSATRTTCASCRWSSAARISKTSSPD